METINREKVEIILDSVRPYLMADNGNVELVNITETGIVVVKLLGACADCPLSTMTLRAGIERALMKEVPQIRRVESIN